MKKRVLMVSCEGLGNGGVQNVMMNIIRNLSDEYRFDMLLFTEEIRCFDDEMEKYGHIYRIPNKRSRIDYFIRFPRIFFGTYRLLTTQRYDVIHCNNDYESGICLLAAFFARVKVRIVHSHRIYDVKSENLLRKMINAFYKFLINIFSSNRIACSQISGKSLFFREFDVVVNPIDLNRFDISKRTKRNDEEIWFIHIGKFCELKNQIFIVKTLFEVKKEIENIHLILVGFGDEYKQQIVEKIEELNMKDIVDFLPSNTDVSMALANSDYMIFPSQQEGLGIALLEAQAMGVYCFVSKEVPSETNVGLCEFLDLKLGCEEWAKRIIQFINANKIDTLKGDIEKYSLDVVLKQFGKIYSS